MRPIIFVCGRNRRDRDRHHHLILIICLLRYKVFFFISCRNKERNKIGGHFVVSEGRDSAVVCCLGPAFHVTLTCVDVSDR